MAYHHSMRTTLELRPNTSIETALDALEPLMRHVGWSRHEVAQQRLGDDDSVDIRTECKAATRITIETRGFVQDDFREHVQALADSLGSLATPGRIELRNDDTVDLENAIELIWYGDPAGVRLAGRREVVLQALALLDRAGFPPAALGPGGGVDGSRPAQDAGPSGLEHVAKARLFWTELLDSVECLTAVVERHGARTLADLFYLQNAILVDGHIDHYPRESGVIDVVRALPSGASWTSYIKLEARGQDRDERRTAP